MVSPLSHEKVWIDLVKLPLPIGRRLNAYEQTVNEALEKAFQFPPILVGLDVFVLGLEPFQDRNLRVQMDQSPSSPGTS